MFVDCNLQKFSYDAFETLFVQNTVSIVIDKAPGRQLFYDNLGKNVYSIFIKHTRLFVSNQQLNCLALER